MFLLNAGKYFIAYDIFKDDGCVGKRFCSYLVARPCLTLHDPMDCSPPGSSVHRIFQARILEWVCEVKVTQSCPILWDFMDYTVDGILQDRTLAWVAFPVSRGSSQPRDLTQVSRIAGGFFNR